MSLGLLVGIWMECLTVGRRFGKCESFGSLERSESNVFAWL